MGPPADRTWQRRSSSLIKVVFDRCFSDIVNDMTHMYIFTLYVLYMHDGNVVPLYEVHPADRTLIRSSVAGSISRSLAPSHVDLRVHTYIFTGMHILSYSHFQCDAKLTSCFPRPPPPPAEDAVCWNVPSRRNYYFRNILFAVFLFGHRCVD